MKTMKRPYKFNGKNRENLSVDKGFPSRKRTEGSNPSLTALPNCLSFNAATRCYETGYEMGVN
jgi:hypothetical protein